MYEGHQSHNAANKMQKTQTISSPMYKKPFNEKWTCTVCNESNTSVECKTCGELKLTMSTGWFCSENDCSDLFCPCCKTDKVEQTPKTSMQTAQGMNKK